MRGDLFGLVDSKNGAKVELIQQLFDIGKPKNVSKSVHVRSSAVYGFLHRCRKHPADLAVQTSDFLSYVCNLSMLLDQYLVPSEIPNSFDVLSIP